ncbi:MAG: tRNA lysidine(34) synthetase TilS [Gemmatimonadaceae bacterium]
MARFAWLVSRRDGRVALTLFGSPATPIASSRLQAAFESLARRDHPIVLAVSGGMDSMVLLHGVASLLTPAERSRIIVATFDHGTGASATAAADAVRRAAERLGMSCLSGREEQLAADEATWRRARWRFLHRAARQIGGPVVTAHTRDDQVETVVMRILRGTGARGIAALYARSPIVRPLLECSRAEIAAYATRMDIAWCDDPSNASRRYLRNRVRHDLLPAMRRVRPGIDAEFLALARRARALRQTLHEVTAEFVVSEGLGRVVSRLPGSLMPTATPVEAESELDMPWKPPALALFWQAMAERAGVALDRRGIERLVGYGSSGRVGSRIPLSAGMEALRRHDSIELRRRPSLVTAPATLAMRRETMYGSWRFRPLAEATISPGLSDDLWVAWLPRDGAYAIRAWRDGDRIVAASGRPRRVKRFFSDLRVPASDREGWPVIVADGEIVWVPGIRRACAATARSGRPVICIACERLHG